MTKTRISNVYVPSNRNLMASSETKAILPDVLIEYLWKLVLSGKWNVYEKQSFMLQSGKLSGWEVQDIYHICDNSNAPDIRRVYGVKPVNCVLQVLHSEFGFKMQLCERI